MGVIKLDKDFLDIEGKVLNAEKECCIQKTDGTLAEKDGNLIVVSVPTPDKKFRLKEVCIKSLLAEVKDDTTDKYEKYKLFKKFHEANKEIDIDSGEIELVKGLIKKCYGTLVFGQAYEMLEGK